MSAVEYLEPEVVVVAEPHQRGRVWRAEIRVGGRLVDVTEWCDRPGEAVKVGVALAAEWGRLRRWTPP